jgi:L-alanine-DL-glutamate epimerase-like enolase superfamily enzyme
LASGSSISSAGCGIGSRGWVDQGFDAVKIKVGGALLADDLRRSRRSGKRSAPRFGGIQEGRRIAELAHAFHLPATLHAASSAVLFAASLHLAACLPNGHSVEYHMLHQWVWNLAPEGCFALETGSVAPPAGPGIGIDLDPDCLDG